MKIRLIAFYPGQPMTSLSNMHVGIARRMCLQTAVAATVGCTGRLSFLGTSEELEDFYGCQTLL